MDLDWILIGSCLNLDWILIQSSLSIVETLVVPAMATALVMASAQVILHSVLYNCRFRYPAWGAMASIVTLSETDALQKILAADGYGVSN